MATLSLCMIVRDEEAVLGRCLDCIAEIADEIIIVDTGSQDCTKQIARKYTDQIYDFPWNDNFSDARNFSFSKASCDYLMWLDADDVLDSENQQKLSELKQNLSADAVMMPYHVAFDAENRPTYTYYRERILKRARHFRWEGAVHEAIAVSGTVLYADIAVQHRKLLVHDPDRNLRIFEKLLAQNIPLCTREKFYFANELYYHQQYHRAVKFYLDFLSQPDGWRENQIDACQKLANCYLSLHQEDNALSWLFHSFLYDQPRAEICCDIGKIQMLRQNWEDAVFWYETALHAPFPDEAGGFSVPDCHDYIPCLQLCVCYDKLRNFSRAKAYNDRAGRIKPKDAAFLFNQKYFRQKLNEECDR